jgi:hypothetical protein
MICPDKFYGYELKERVLQNRVMKSMIADAFTKRHFQTGYTLNMYSFLIGGTGTKER